MNKKIIQWKQEEFNELPLCNIMEESKTLKFWMLEEMKFFNVTPYCFKDCSNKKELFKSIDKFTRILKTYIYRATEEQSFLLYLKTSRVIEIGRIISNYAYMAKNLKKQKSERWDLFYDKLYKEDEMVKYVILKFWPNPIPYLFQTLASSLMEYSL